MTARLRHKEEEKREMEIRAKRISEILHAAPSGGRK
jgi:hypothetical protein